MRSSERPGAASAPETWIGRRRVLAILGSTMVLLALVEFALQLYAHVRTGQSVWTRVESGSEYVGVPGSNLRILRPNAVFRGNVQEVRTNSLGLRSPELPAAKEAGEYRLAVIGASSVMGAYARSNDETVSAELERRLRRALPGEPVNVINGGIAGSDLADQVLMFDYLVEHLHPDIVLLYPGTNDFAAYCRPAAGNQPSRWHMPQVELPQWVMTDDMLLKNTVQLRPAAKAGRRKVDPRSIDLTPFRSRLDELFERAAAQHVAVVLTTNTRSYRPDQPPAVQDKLAETARYYNACFDVPGLNVLYDRHNQVIREAAARHGAPLVEAGEAIPGGTAFFRDSEHLNDQGIGLLAGLFAGLLHDSGYPGRHGGRP